MIKSLNDDYFKIAKLRSVIDNSPEEPVGDSEYYSATPNNY